MSEVEKIKQEYEDKLARAIIADQISAVLPPDPECMARLIHVNELYGSAAAINYRPGHYLGRTAPLAFVLDLLERFPLIGVSRVRARQGWVSYMPTSYADGLPEGEVTEQTDLLPVYLDCNGPFHTYQPKLEVRWFAEVAGQVCRIQIELDRYRGAFDYQYRREDRRGGFILLSDGRRGVARDLEILHGDHGDHGILADRATCYAGGSSEALGNVVQGYMSESLDHELQDCKTIIRAVYGAAGLE